MATQETTLAIVLGLADDLRAKVAMNRSTGRLIPQFIGSASYLVQLRDEAPLAHAARVFVGPNLRPRLKGEAPEALVNMVTDPDVCSIALQQLALIAREWGATCFNPPAAVRATTRDGISRMLQGLPGVIMPRTIRIRPRRPGDVFAAVREAGLGFPCLARIPGDHGGVSLVQLAHDQDEEALCTIPWGGRELYLTEFVDFADPDGRYRKVRIAVVGDRFFPRHLLVGDQWLLHAGRRDPASGEEEARFLETFEAATAPQIREAVEAIMSRVRLDYYGIDCSIRPDGRLLLFEVNPSMDILRNSRPSPNHWDAPIAAIREALLALLRDPSRWSGQPGTTPAGA